MGGTLSNIYNNASFALSLHIEAMARLQEQVATGSRINRSSDDPSAAYRLLGFNSQERSLKNYIDGLSEVIDSMTFSSTIIGSIGLGGDMGYGIKSALAEAKSLIITITGTGAAQAAIAQGVDSALEQIVSLANTKYMNHYLFGGSDTGSAPYLVGRTDGKITSVTYQGALENRDIEVAPGVETSAFYVGEDIFHVNERSTPVFTGATGAAAGTGTSSVQGDVWLTVTGSPGNYKLSIDGGLSTFDAGPANLAVTDSRTGAGSDRKVLYVDSSSITGTGTEWVRVPGTYDVFNTLISLRDRLETSGGLDTNEMGELRSNAIEAIEEVNNLLVQKSVSLGSKIGFLDNLKDSLNNIKYNVEDETARLEEVDIAQIAIDLSRQEILYQMSLATIGKIMSMSLLDFIR